MKEDKDKPSDQQVSLARKLLDGFTTLLSKTGWDSTLLLRSTKKRIEALRDRAKALVEEPDDASRAAESFSTVPPEGYVTVYVSLYQSESRNINVWSSTIKALAEHSISRPVYAEETHVQELIRNKANPATEAYCAVHVKREDIVPPYQGKVAQDRFGHDLLSLKERAVRLENVVEFVHEGKVYSCKKGQLILKVQ